MKTDRPDVDVKSMAPLSIYGRDEEYMDNKLWLDGISSLILKGVGDGMVPWCALQKRIPIMCVYDKELHKKTIEAFLLEKIIKKMEEAPADDTRWYRTAAQLGCRDDSGGARARAAKAKAAATAKTAAAKAAAAAKEKDKRPSEASEEGESSPSSSSPSASSKKKPKAEEKKKED